MSWGGNPRCGLAHRRQHHHCWCEMLPSHGSVVPAKLSAGGIHVTSFQSNKECDVYIHNVFARQTFLLKLVISQSKNYKWYHPSACLLFDSRYIGHLVWLFIHEVVQLVFLLVVVLASLVCDGPREVSRNHGLLVDATCRCSEESARAELQSQSLVWLRDRRKLQFVVLGFPVSAAQYAHNG